MNAGEIIKRFLQATAHFMNRIQLVANNPSVSCLVSQDYSIHVLCLYRGLTQFALLTMT